MSPRTSPVLFPAGMMAGVLLFYVAILAFLMVVYWRIASKAGYPGWYAFALLVPCLNFIAMIAFAFVEWPVEAELNQFRAWQRNQQAGGYPRNYPPNIP